MPLPTALAAWSPAPPTTGVPSFKPVAFAAAADTVPVTSVDSFTSGRIDASSLSRSIIGFDQRRVTTSNRPVPEASVTSVAYSPVSMNRT